MKRLKALVGISLYIFWLMIAFPITCLAQNSQFQSFQHHNDGIVKYKNNDLYGAIASFHESYILNPTAKTAYTMAYIFVQIKDFNAAKYWAERSLRDFPPLSIKQRDGARMIYNDPIESRVRIMIAGADGPGFPGLPRMYEERCFPSSLVSEETSSAICSQGFAVKGMWCTGPYCDNKVLNCCTLTMPNSRNNAYWSGWFSEEYSNISNYTGGPLIGLQCSGKYCDNISVLVQPLSPDHRFQCYQTPFFSEEGEGYMGCSNNFFVSGMSCKNNYCDNIALICCPY